MATGVSIDVDLNIGEALTKIGVLKTQLKTLDEDLDLGISSDDIGELEVEDLELSDSSESKLTESPTPYGPDSRRGRGRDFDLRDVFDDLSIDITGGGTGGSGSGGGGGRSSSGGGLGSKATRGLKKILPTDMRKWYRLIAVLLPVLVTFIGILSGVAAAMGGVAVAGASLIGLGLLGWGENLGDSMQEARVRLKEFANEIYNVLQAPMQSFAPISQGFLDMISGEMSRLVEPLQGLTVFEDTLRKAGRGIIGFVADSIQGLVKYEEKISEIALAFGNLIGHSVQNFFAFVLEFVDEGGQAFVRLASTIKYIILTLFEFSEIFGAVIAAFRMLFIILYKVGKVLSDTFVMSVLAALAVTFALNRAVVGLISRLAILAGTSMWKNVSNFFKLWYQGGIRAAIGTYTLNSAVKTLTISVMTLFTVLLPVIGGLMTLSSMSSQFGSDFSGGESYGAMGGSGTYIDNTEINVQGDADRKSTERIRDISSDETDIKMGRERRRRNGS